MWGSMWSRVSNEHVRFFKKECGGACQDCKVLKKSEAGEALSMSGSLRRNVFDDCNFHKYLHERPPHFSGCRPVTVTVRKIAPILASHLVHLCWSYRVICNWFRNYWFKSCSPQIGFSSSSLSLQSLWKSHRSIVFE